MKKPNCSPNDDGSILPLVDKTIDDYVESENYEDNEGSDYSHKFVSGANEDENDDSEDDDGDRGTGTGDYH